MSGQQKREIFIRNVTDLPLLIKGQIQSNKNRCSLSMLPEKMLLLPRETQSLEFALKPSATEEKIESTVVIGAVQSFKYLKLKAKISQPKFVFLNEMDRKINRVYEMQAVKKGKKATGCLRMKNDGDVAVVFNIDSKSDELKIEPSAGSVPVGGEMPVNLWMRCPDNSDGPGIRATVSVKGCEKSQLTILGRWIDPVPAFSKKTVEFMITTEQLVHMVMENERSLELTARNKLINRDDIPVTVYPPESDDFTFDQPYYSFEGKGEIDVEMKWTVRRLKKQQHTVTFLTDTGKKLPFKVHLSWAAGKLEITPTSWLSLKPVNHGETMSKDIRIDTTGQFAILNKAPRSELIETLSLTELRGGHPKKDQEPLFLGSDDVSTVFCSSKQFKICVQAKEGKGWIVEDLAFQTEQAVFVHEDPEKCQLMHQKLTIVAPVSDTPNVLANLMQSCKKSGGSGPASKNTTFCLPNLDILREISSSPSTVQSFLLMMLCEVEILQKEWKVTTELARRILDSDPDEAVSLCADHLKHLEKASRRNAGPSSTLADYFEKLKDHFEERGHSDMSEICIPLAAVSNTPVNIQAVAQATYMLLHADCTEKQQWKSAAAVIKTTISDTFSATLFDDICEAIADLLDDQEFTLSDVLTLLNSLLISADEEIISFGLLGKILWTFQSSDINANLDQAIASVLPEHIENGGILLQAAAASSDQSDRLELMVSLVNKTIKDAVDRLCPEDPKAIVAGFCDLVQASNDDLNKDSLIGDLVCFMSGKNAQKMKSLREYERMDHEHSTITQLLKRAKLESVASPLCQLYGHRIKHTAKQLTRSITVEALFNVLLRHFDGHRRVLGKIKKAALKVSDDLYGAFSFWKERIIDRELEVIKDVNCRSKLKDLIEKWIKSDPRKDGMESLLKPLIKAVNEVLCSDEGSSSQTPAADLQLIEEQVIKALTELDPCTISREMDFNELFVRLIRFCSLLTDDNDEHVEVVDGLSALTVDATKEDALCFCRAIAKELFSNSLESALELLEEDLGDDENLQEMVLHCVMPEQMVDEFDAMIESWSGIDSDVNEEEVFKKMEKLSEPSAMVTFKLVGDVVKAKNSVTHMDEEQMESIEGLLKIKKLFDSLSALGCWEEREKSRAVWNILLSASAIGYGAELTLEGLCLAKMSLLLSLTEFYGKGHWKKRESPPSCADDRCLKLKIADVPEDLPSEESSDEEAEAGEEIASCDEAKISEDENEATVASEDGEWQWLLENFEGPEEQLVSFEEESSRETEMSVTEIVSTDLAGDVCGQSSSGYMEKLTEVEDILKAVMKSIADSSASPIEDSSLRALTFDRIADAITEVKTAADSWNEVFEEAVRHSHIRKKGKETNADSRVVCAGLSLISQIQFFERYLERCTLFEIPRFVKDALDGIVQHLNAIPKSNLPAEFGKILKEFGATTIVKGSTTEDFPLPSRHHFLSQTEKATPCGNDYREGGSSSSCLAVASGYADEAMLIDTMKSDFLKKVTDTVMSSYTTESISSLKPQTLLDQKITLSVKQDSQLWKFREAKTEEQSSITEDSRIEERSQVKLPSVIEGRTRQSGQSGFFSQHKTEAGDLDQAFDIFTDAAVDETMETVPVNFDIDEKATLQSVRNADLAEIYKDAPITRADVDKRELKDPVSVDPVRHDKWTYSLLVESKPFVLFLVEVMRRWEAHFEKFYTSTAEKHVIQWCILVDNSGSMITKEIQMTEALVLVMETLRRLEQPFAVARFGDRKSQQMLKTMDKPFTQLIGQKILESFSFNEGTYPASAVRHVAEKVWPDRLSEDERLQCHRVMLLIVDGLTQERSPKDYTSICEQKEFELVVLNLKDEAQKEIMSQIEGLWSKAASCYEVLDIRSIDLLPQLLAGLMIQYMESTFTKIVEKNRNQPRSTGRPVIQAPCLENAKFNEEESVLLADLKKQTLPKLPGDFSKKSFFESGCATDGIPYATEMKSLLNTDLELDAAALDCVEKELLDLHQSLQVQPEGKEQLKSAEAVWMKAEEWLSVEIAHMVEALEGFLPQNRFTRKRADIQGPSIHLPGFIKHIATQGNEKKIFANKKGGGKSEYSVAVLLDISASMAQGRKRPCALQTVVMLISALKQMNIEDFSVILFGGGIYPIKLPDDVWEAPSMALLFSAVLHRNELSTMDADALLFAAQLLDQSSVRGPKKIFVVTDGYGSSGVRLAGVLHKIEEDLGVDVLAMGVGPEEFFVKKCYPKWITAALPQMVPDALESMSDKMESAARLQKTNQKDVIDWQKIASFKDGAAETIEEVLRNRESVFPDLLKEMKTDREAKLKRGNKPSAFTVDVCFTLDCTGSMIYWMKAAKEQINVRLPSQYVTNNECQS